MQVFETPGSVSLRFKLPSGRVVVTTAEEPQTTVELVPLGRRDTDALDKVEITHEQRGGRHVITVEEKDQFRWGPIRITWGGDVEVRVTCPPGSDLELTGGSTDLEATGELGQVDASSASGDIEVETATKRLQVKTASGDVTIGAIEAGATVGTVSGDIDIRRIEGTVAARSVSGDVHMGSIRAAFQLSTTSGDVELESVEAGEVRAQSVSGDIRIGVGRGTRVFIDAASVSGTLQSELGVDDFEPPAPEQRESEEPGDVVPLHVKTVSGDVTIARATSVSAF